MSRESISAVRNVAILIVTFTLLPAHLLAQSPWERAASRLELAFTGPLARSLALVAIVIGGQHPNRRQQHHQRSNAEEHVQQF